MDIFIPQDWHEVSIGDFEKIMEQVNYKRDWYCRGVEYHTAYWPSKYIAAKLDDGRCFIAPELFKT